MANKEACQRVLDWTLAHPEHHDQRTWACDTTLCMAGTAIMLEHYGETRTRELALSGTGTLELSNALAFKHNGGYGEQAQELLGLTEDQADALFRASLPNDEAVRMLKEIINEEESE